MKAGSQGLSLGLACVRGLARGAARLVLDFNLYSLIDEIVAGNVVPWRATLEVLAYSSAYVGVLLAAAAWLFEGRDL